MGEKFRHILQCVSSQRFANCSILPSWMGEHGEHREHGKDGKHQPGDLKHSIYDSEHSIYDSKHSFCQPDDSKHSIFGIYGNS